MRNIYVLGSINMDMVITTPYIPASGETLTGSNFFLNSGGKGANQAVAAAKQNVYTYLIGNTGTDIFGTEICKTLKQYSVKTEYIHQVDTTTGVAMIILCNKNNRIILDKGANDTITQEQISKALENAREKDIFIAQLENNYDAVSYGIKLAKSKKMITIFNPAPAKKLDFDIFNSVDYLIMNETECEILSNINPLNKMEVLKAYQALRVENLILTLGDKGSLYIHNNEIIEIKPHKIQAIDTTAAGDTYIGVFAAQLAKNIPVLSALYYASVASALTCLKKGAQQSIPTLNELNAYLNQ